LRDDSHGIAVKLLAPYGKVEGAAKNRAVFIDRRGRELVLQILQKSLHLIRLDVPGPFAPESLPDPRKVVVEAAAGLFAVLLPPVVK